MYFEYIFVSWDLESTGIIYLITLQQSQNSENMCFVKTLTMSLIQTNCDYFFVDM